MNASTTVRRTTAALLCGAAAIVPALPAQAHGTEDSPHSTSRLTSAQREVIRDVTHHFKHPAAAVAAGYLPSQHCTELPGVGGMGYHYVNPVFASDGQIDAARPEILVYVPGEHGRLRLGAVEYFRPDADQDPSTTDDRPNLFDQYPFDGPMPGHEPGMPMHYDLHVWLYKHNPSGQLAPWNPRVSCPSGG